MTNFVTKAFFAAAVLACASVAFWRLTTWTASPIVPETDVPTLILLGILAHFAFDRKAAKPA